LAGKRNDITRQNHVFGSPTETLTKPAYKPRRVLPGFAPGHSNSAY
jgi:hypothetical protein